MLKLAKGVTHLAGVVADASFPKAETRDDPSARPPFHCFRADAKADCQYVTRNQVLIHGGCHVFEIEAGGRKLIQFQSNDRNAGELACRPLG